MQWKLYKRTFLNNGVAPLKDAAAKEFKSAMKGVKKTRKATHAHAFINVLCEIYFGETIASHEGANLDGTSRNIKVLPYETVSQLYEVSFCI